jgi:hypothetical protein
MARVNISYKGLGELLRSDMMQAEMRARAEKVKALAEQTAPVDETGPHPGRYRDSFRVTSGVRLGRNRRAYGRVENDSPEAFWVEYGSVHNEAHHTLARALDAARD